MTGAACGGLPSGLVWAELLCLLFPMYAFRRACVGGGEKWIDLTPLGTARCWQAAQLAQFRLQRQPELESDRAHAQMSCETEGSRSVSLAAPCCQVSPGRQCKDLRKPSSAFAEHREARCPLHKTAFQIQREKQQRQMLHRD